MLKPIHTATPDATKLSCPCRVRFGGVNWIPDNSRLSPTENLKFEHADSNIVQFTPSRLTPVVKVRWDARERRSGTSGYWQIAFLHLQGRTNAQER